MIVVVNKSLRHDRIRPLIESRCQAIPWKMMTGIHQVSHQDVRISMARRHNGSAHRGCDIELERRIQTRDGTAIPPAHVDTPPYPAFILSECWSWRHSQSESSSCLIHQSRASCSGGFPSFITHRGNDLPHNQILQRLNEEERLEDRTKLLFAFLYQSQLVKPGPSNPPCGVIACTDARISHQYNLFGGACVEQ